MDGWGIKIIITIIILMLGISKEWVTLQQWFSPFLGGWKRPKYSNRQERWWLDEEKRSTLTYGQNEHWCRCWRVETWGEFIHLTKKTLKQLTSCTQALPLSYRGLCIRTWGKCILHWSGLRLRKHYLKWTTTHNILCYC